MTTYSNIGDIIVILISIVFLVLIKLSFASRNRSFFFFFLLCYELLAMSGINIFLHYLLTLPSENNRGLLFSMIVLRISWDFCVFLILYTFVVYIQRSINIDPEVLKAHILFLSVSLFVFLISSNFYHFYRIYNIYMYNTEFITNVGFVVPIGYIYFLFFISYTTIYYRKRIYNQVIAGVFFTATISFLILIHQIVFNSMTLFSSALLFPVLAIFYLCHANPFDVETGIASARTFYEMITYFGEHNKNILFVEIYMHSFEKGTKKSPDMFKTDIYNLFKRYFKNTMIFQISSGTIVLTADMGNMRQSKGRLNSFSKDIAIILRKYHIDYKEIALLGDQEIDNGEDYLSLMKYIGSDMEENTFRIIGKDDYDAYVEQKYILSELEDIREKNNIYDERVLVYCQPVYNMNMGRYDTAEALMRLNLSKLGIVSPSKFISLAEKNDCIQILGLIIFQKTCLEIKSLLDMGYVVNRISVNFTISDMRDKNFTKNILNIIENTGIPFKNIAIEITESQNESDFNAIKQKISELKKCGIKFYLDDFGTGYSNFERIMELPFDIIKFDQSIVTGSIKDEERKKMVSHLADMFDDAGYTILYEGIEELDDIKKCSDMHGKYMQGFYYTEPIPIEELTCFFEKEKNENCK